MGTLVSMLIGMSALFVPPAGAATFAGAHTHRKAREEAIAAIPYDQLTPEVQNRIAAVVAKPTVYRRMPVKVIDCDPSLYLFLVRHPEVVVNVWDLMGATQIQLERAGPFTFLASDGMGTTSKVDLVFGTQDIHLVFGEGVYDGPLCRKPVRGRCVLLLRCGYVATASGRTHVTNQLDVFLQLDHVGVEVLTKVIHPLFGHTADMNFVETAVFLERMSRTAERNGAGMERLARRLTKVDPTVRQQLVDVATAVQEKSAQQAGWPEPGIPTLVDKQVVLHR